MIAAFDCAAPNFYSLFLDAGESAGERVEGTYTPINCHGGFRPINLGLGFINFAGVATEAIVLSHRLRRTCFEFVNCLQQRGPAKIS